MLQIGYSQITMNISEEILQKYLAVLPLTLKKRVIRFKRKEDVQRCLIGKIILMNQLKEYGFDKSYMREIRYSSYNKPYFENGPDFNISHSGSLVACLVGDGYSLGIDVEKIRPILKSDFINVWTSKEHKMIQEDAGFDRFYRFWTRKEAVAKAEGKGLLMPLKNIDVSEDMARVNGKSWYLKEIKLHKDYAVSIASDNASEDKIILKQYSIA